ncbi:MAG: hypothetical protein BWX70_02456 [Verrucomicrobia bacterium ADurb.Bin070]|nr:MAG: hypothetical protein BWX70_02456 [Verrucomicrobia bacterium ADurb.Bin070]
MDLFGRHQRLVDELDDLQHTVDILLRVGDQQAVGTLKRLDQPVGPFEAFDRLLRLADRDGLKLDHLTDHLTLFRISAVWRIHLDADAIGTHGFERQNL